MNYVYSLMPITFAEIIQRGFVGCLKDVYVMKNYSPSVTWIPLDWQSSEEQVNMYHSWEGCPTVLEDGVQFLGAGEAWLVTQQALINFLSQSQLSRSVDLRS